MDILNIISWVKGKRQVTSVDPTKSLIPVAQKDDRRDDGYLTGVISVEDLLAASASVIGVNGTTLYSTNPLAGSGTPYGNSILIGLETGIDSNAGNTVFLGTAAGNTATNAENSVFIGGYSGYLGTESYNSNFIGQLAGYTANNAYYSNFIGTSTGQAAYNAYHSNFLGRYAGQSANGANNSNFFGNNAGAGAGGANNSNFIGIETGFQATLANNSNFIGAYAGQSAFNAYHSNFLGKESGQRAFNANNSNFLGQNAGTDAETAYRSNFLGLEAGMNSTGNNVNAFGYQAHKGGSLSGQTVFSNATLPSYVNRAAATTAITVPNGAVVGSTYLYYNQTTFAIEAVRL